MRDCAGLEKGPDGSGEVRAWVDAERARGLARRNGAEVQGGWEVTVPEGGKGLQPHDQVRWDAGDEARQGSGVFTGGGSGGAHMETEMYLEDGTSVGTLRDEISTSLLMRNDEFEARACKVRDRNGREIEMDKAESKLLRWDRGRTGEVESLKVARVVMPLHIVHHFTHMAATDGSKGAAWSEERERWEARASYGVFEGIQGGERQGGETALEAAARWTGEGMWGGALPGWMEVVDAELMAVLQYLRRVVAEESDMAVERTVRVRLHTCAPGEQLLGVR